MQFTAPRKGSMRFIEKVARNIRLFTVASFKFMFIYCIRQ